MKSMWVVGAIVQYNENESEKIFATQKMEKKKSTAPSRDTVFEKKKMKCFHVHERRREQFISLIVFTIGAQLQFAIATCRLWRVKFVYRNLLPTKIGQFTFICGHKLPKRQQSNGFVTFNWLCQLFEVNGLFGPPLKLFKWRSKSNSSAVANEHYVSAHGRETNRRKCSGTRMQLGHYRCLSISAPGPCTSTNDTVAGVCIFTEWAYHLHA